MIAVILHSLHFSSISFYILPVFQFKSLLCLVFLSSVFIFSSSFFLCLFCYSFFPFPFFCYISFFLFSSCVSSRRIFLFSWLYFRVFVLPFIFFCLLFACVQISSPSLLVRFLYLGFSFWSVVFTSSPPSLSLSLSLSFLFSFHSFFS